ncbi:MAG: alpha/beta fold hydrolase [Candidatus Acidiferrales bacterium]
MSFNFRRIVLISLGSVAGLILILAVVGFTYEQVGRNREAQHRFRIGRAVDIGGRTLNIDCSGEGSPAVILLPTRFGGYGGYPKVRPEVAKFTRVCWYDRAGEGWSDPPPAPRTSASITNDLHELLQRATVPGPYILVGHSIGGDFARIYAGRFPAEVAGLVLVDSANPDQNEPPIMLARINRMPIFVRELLCWSTPVASRFGLVRFFMRNDPVDLPPQFAGDANAVTQTLRDQQVKYAETEDAQACAATQNGAILRHGGSGNPEIDDAARRVTDLGNMPIIVLTAAQYWKPDDDPVAAQQITEFQEAWVHQLQPALAHLSTQGRQIIVSNSDHGIPDQAPEAVIDAIRSIVDKTRTAPSSGAGRSDRTVHPSAP